MENKIYKNKKNYVCLISNKLQKHFKPTNKNNVINLAKLMRAFCPPLSTKPLSPTTVESPL